MQSTDHHHDHFPPRTVAADDLGWLLRALEGATHGTRPAGPVAWSGGEDGSGGAGDAGGGDGGDDPAGDAGDAADGGDEGAGDGDEGGAGDGDRSAAEAAALKRRLDAETKARKKAERELLRRKNAEREEAGEYKTMYEEQKAENETLRRSILDGAYERAVEAKARDLKFRNPSIAASLLPKSLRENAVDEDGEVDERLVERELKGLAKRESYLVQQAGGQRPATGDESQRRPQDAAEQDDTFNPRGRLNRAYGAQTA